MNRHVPIFDRYGLHAVDCPCARCEAGYCPTPQQRQNARSAYEAAQRDKSAAGPRKRGEARRIEVAARTAAELAKAEAEAERYLGEQRRIAASPPPSSEELAELRAEFGIKPIRR